MTDIEQDTWVPGWACTIITERHPCAEEMYWTSVRGTHADTGLAFDVTAGKPGFHRQDNTESLCHDIGVALTRATTIAARYNLYGLECGEVFWKPGDDTPYGIKAWLRMQ